MKKLFEHYHLTDKSDCYYNIKQAFLNTVQNKYSTFNYSQLYKFNKENITKNIKSLYDNMHNYKENVSDVEKKINEILKTETIMDVIEYVGTLTDEIILKYIPDMPRFIVEYLNADLSEKHNIDNNIRTYTDIKNMLP